MLKLLFVSLSALCLVMPFARAQSPVITSFSENGILSWTNQAPGERTTIQWSSSLQGPWQSSWEGLSDFFSQGDVQSVAVPMFYRVTRIPTNGIIAHYPLTYGGNDISGNGRHGVLHNAAPDAGFTSLDSSMRFTGTHSYVRCGSHDIFNIGTNAARTVAFWVKTDATNNQFLIGKFDALTANSGFHMRATEGELSVAINNMVKISFDNALETGVWNHVAALFNHPTNYMFLNGVPVGTNVNWTEPRANTNELYLGTRSYGQAGLIGCLRNVLIYDRALSEEEIAAVMMWK